MNFNIVLFGFLFLMVQGEDLESPLCKNVKFTCHGCSGKNAENDLHCSKPPFPTNPTAKEFREVMNSCAGCCIKIVAGEEVREGCDVGIPLNFTVVDYNCPKENGMCLCQSSLCQKAEHFFLQSSASSTPLLFHQMMLLFSILIHRIVYLL